MWWLFLGLNLIEHGVQARLCVKLSAACMWALITSWSPNWLTTLLPPYLNWSTLPALCYSFFRLVLQTLHEIHKVTGDCTLTYHASCYVGSHPGQIDFIMDADNQSSEAEGAINEKKKTLYWSHVHGDMQWNLFSAFDALLRSSGQLLCSVQWPHPDFHQCIWSRAPTG